MATQISASRIRRAPVLILPGGDGRLHAKLYHQLREMIRAGDWAPGTRIPSSRVLAQDLGVSRNTASVALEHLVAEGWAESRSRSGVFVSRRLPQPTANPPASQPAVSGSNVYRVPDLPLDLFPLRCWRSLHARLWALHGHDLLRAPPPEGEPALREAIARLVCTARGFRAEPQHIFITGNADATVSAIAAALGCGGDAQSARTLVCSPAIRFPEGGSLNQAGRQALLRWAADNRWLIERDCGGWASSAAGRPAPPLRSEREADQVVYVRGFDDVLFPGLPICFTVAPRRLAPQIAQALLYQLVRPSRADQLAFKDFVAEGHLAAHLRRLQRMLPQRRENLRRLLAEVNGRMFRILSAHLPRHLLVEPRTGDLDAATSVLRSAGLEAEPVEADRLLVSFGGLSDAAVVQIRAQLGHWLAA